jgi:hypothetical protein
VRLFKFTNNFGFIHSALPRWSVVYASTVIREL